MTRVTQLDEDFLHRLRAAYGVGIAVKPKILQESWAHSFQFDGAPITYAYAKYLITFLERCYPATLPKKARRPL